MILFQRPQAVDWFHLLNDFKKLGYKIPEIARALNCPDRTVYSWSEGTCPPKYEDGRALVMLYQVKFFRDPPSKPTTPAEPFVANRYS